MKNYKPLIELNPEKFTFELYEPNYAERLGTTYEMQDIGRKIVENGIGWCDASRLLVRPKSHMIAIMCEDENFEKFWFHTYASLLDAAYGNKHDAWKK